MAADGRIALMKIPQVTPDLVLLDVEMPNMDGLACLAEIRKRWPKLPVIMFSTLTTRGAVATLDALTLGASDYVPKPRGMRSPTDVVAYLEEHLVPRIHALCPEAPPPAAVETIRPARRRAARVQKPVVRRTRASRARGRPRDRGLDRRAERAGRGAQGLRADLSRSRS